MGKDHGCSWGGREGLQLGLKFHREPWETFSLKGLICSSTKYAMYSSRTDTLV